MYVVLEKNVVENHHLHSQLPSLPLLALPFNLVCHQHRGHFLRNCGAYFRRLCRWRGDLSRAGGAEYWYQGPSPAPQMVNKGQGPARMSSQQQQEIGPGTGLETRPKVYSGLDTSTTATRLVKGLAAPGWAGPWESGRRCQGKLVRAINQVLDWGTLVPAAPWLSS